MPKTVETATGVPLTLADTPFAGGGEADLFRVGKPANRRGQVVKLYKSDKRTADRARKIEFLVQHPPGGLLTGGSGHRAVIWPVEAVQEQGRFAGFIMPEAPGEKLELLCLPSLPPPLKTTWGRFDRSRPESRELRLKLCFNLAVALFQVHESGQYVLVDMKPDNIIVRPDGLVALIDLDSVQVLNHDRLLFAAPVTTPEYSPSEPIPTRQGQPAAIDPTWDRFSLAVIFYRLLCGIHPFTGTAKPPLDRQTDTAGMIRHGLFPNGRRAGDFAVVPAPHRLFGQLPPAVQRLFRQCFDDGHDDPTARPTADDWCRALSGQAQGAAAETVPGSHRRLPSVRFSGQGLNLAPSQLLDWPLSPPPDVPTVAFAKLDGAGGFWSGFRRLLGSSAGPVLYRAAVLAQTQVRQDLVTLSGYESQFARIVQEQEVRQATVLAREQADLSQIITTWTRLLADLDREAGTDASAEMQVVRQARQTLEKEIQRVDNQKQAVYTRLVGKLEADLNRQQAALQQRADALAEDREKARQRGLFHPKKLVGYRIDTDKQAIFGANLNVVVQKLAQAGIQTAADFIDVHDGQFQRPGRGWVKVPGVGTRRTEELMVWRQAVETRHDALLQTMLDTQFAPQQQQLLTDRQTLQTHFDSLLTQARAQFTRETAPITAQLTDLTRQADALAAAASVPFDERDADRLYRAEQTLQRLNDRADQRRQQTTTELQQVLLEETTRYDTLRRHYLTDRAHLLTAIDQMHQAEMMYLS